MPLPTPVPSTSSTPLHRLRFPDHSPSPITALSFTPSPLPPADPSWNQHQGGTSSSASASITAGPSRTRASPAQGQMADLFCARSDGTIEIYNWVVDDSLNSNSGESFEEDVGGEVAGGIGGMGGKGAWVLRRVLPATLSHPSISHLVLALRHPHPSSTSVPSSPSSPVVGLEGLRCFTAGNEGDEVVERCLFTGRILKTTPLPSGPIWSLSLSPLHTHLAISTSHPSIHILHLASSDVGSDLEIVSGRGTVGANEGAGVVGRLESLPGKVRTLGMSWGAPVRVQVSSTSEDGMDTDKLPSASTSSAAASRWTWKSPTHLYTAHSDACIRKFSLTTGRIVGRMAVGKGEKGKARSVVWGVEVLADGTVISADSLGMVTFWDGNAMVQLKSFKAHAADALCMTVSPDGQAVYTAGPDQKVAQFTFTPSKSTSSSGKKITGEWQQTSLKRLHRHDIRAIAMYPSYSPFPARSPAANSGFAPILASGGLDMGIVFSSAAHPDSGVVSRLPTVNPITSKGKAIFNASHKVENGWTPKGYGNGIVSFAEERGLVMVRRGRGVGIWKVRGLGKGGVEGERGVGGWEKVLEMAFAVRTTLTAAAISPNGEWLAVSDLYETKLFYLRYTIDDSTESILSCKTERLKSLTPILHSSLPSLSHTNTGTGSSTLAFSLDSKLLILGLALQPRLVFIEVDAEGSEEGFEVLKVGGMRGREGNVGRGGRSVKRLPRRGNGRELNGNGHAAQDDEDDEMASQSGNESDSGSSAPGAEHHSDVDGDSPSSESENDDDEGSSARKALAVAVQMTISEDGQWLAVQDGVGRVVIWTLDTFKIYSVLPTFYQPPSSLIFSTPSTLLLAFPGSNTLQRYNIDQRRLLPGSVRVSHADERVAGLVAVRGRGEKVLAWGWNWVTSVDLSGVGDGAGHGVKAGSGAGKRRKGTMLIKAAINGNGHLNGKNASQTTSPSISSAEEPTTPTLPYKLVGRYTELGGVALMPGGELIVVERPFTDLEGLPAAFVKASYVI